MCFSKIAKIHKKTNLKSFLPYPGKAERDNYVNIKLTSIKKAQSILQPVR